MGRTVSVQRAGVLLALVACNPRPSGDSEGLGCSTCVNEPWQREVLSPGCNSSAQCPIGTSCVYQAGASEMTFSGPPPSTLQAACESEPPVDLSCPSLEDPEPTWCAISSGPADRTALRSIFRVPRFELFPPSDGGTVFTWDAPRGARVVACALFRCVPAAAWPEESGDGELDTTIANYDDCFLAEGRFDPAAGAFDLLDELGRRSDAQIGETCLYDDPQLRIDYLLVGCWAYSETALIGATSLLNVPPASAGPFSAYVVEAGQCAENDGLSCRISDSQPYGDCIGGACVPRCVVDADCGQDCCQREPGTYVGHCAERGP